MTRASRDSTGTRFRSRASEPAVLLWLDTARPPSTRPGHDPARMVASIKAYQDAGVDNIVLALNSGDVSALKRLMETIASEVLPEFR